MERRMMKFPLLLLQTQFFLLSFLLIVASLADDDSIPLNDDVLGLIVFKSSLHSGSSELESWNEDDTSPCAWRFIKCNPRNGRVSELSLDGLGLSGKIGRGLEKLQDLKVLSLANNNFTGNISPELALLNGLEKLNLSMNHIDGSIPASLANMSSIQFLDLSYNSLSGPLPENLFRTWKSLRFISLASNFLEGPFPTSLSECTDLNHLNLSNNHFSGDPNFKEMFQSLTRLRTLDLSNNELSGELPFGISALHNLKEISLQGNHFSGSLPADIGFCPHLSRVELNGNFFSGRIPDSVQQLNELRVLSATHNFLNGDFPQWIDKLSSLEYLDLSGNNLQGSIPSSIGEMKSLQYLSLSNNRLSGIIPHSISSCSSLSSIQLKGNAFNGSIPEGLFELGLDEIDLSRNQLTGPIPKGSTKLLDSLEVLDLSGNNLSGVIPSDMGLYVKLRYLNMSLNNFESEIPPELGHCKNLTVLDLRDSALTGSIPRDICDSGSLRILQLDENSLIGPFPSEIDNCSSLFLLSLSHNNITGPIPKSISSLKKLKILKLEFNQLTGEIPQDLGRLENLLSVNVSHNQLIGKLPDGGIFPNLDRSALEGNLGICSPLLRGPCKMSAAKPLVLNPFAYGNHHGGDIPSDGSSDNIMGFRRRRFLSVSAIIAISAAAAIAIGVIIITLINASVRRRLAFINDALESMCSSSNRSGSVVAGKLIFFDSKSSPDWITTSLESMLNKATEVGGGVFGTVYRASLGDEGRVVAVKKLITSNIVECPEDFDREVRTLGKANHQNIISLRGYYWTPQLQFIVSDFAPGGSLQAKLHERHPTSAPLNWASRFKIILGTARGLAYLHHSFRPPIIHYNIKPSNILLDDHMNPKISDYGLARLVTKLDKHVLSNRFQNALGYVAPELACQNLRVSEKCDVFGFGVLILEIVTGRRPVEYGEDNVVILSDHVRVLLDQGNVLDCVDPSLESYHEEEVLPVLKLALVCTSQIPSSRPSMEEVVQILQVIKTASPQREASF
ncbi:OLC1v1018603C1 [Oldenlandia corymbosa var. corymbosa]|uniref:OLC1v1018603C1 n=1 Tax=Oldenlandia corymbosa var. corymbosa TaxID=529605 RepID=A0AAV1EBZ9_OLDCO|nr:OLC1v1018603C1 [Oldenlandia corymbosa var. corymbosa]